MNPRIVKQHIDAYNKKKERELEHENFFAYLQGIYVLEALNCTVGNMFKPKGAKPNTYPKEPFPLGKSQNSMSEEELDRQRQEFMASLMVMKSNFELSKKEKEV